MIHSQLRIFIWLTIFFFYTQAAAEFKVPKLTKPVTDQVGLLSPAVNEQLNHALASLYNRGGSQIHVLIIPSLEGLSLEQASIQIADQWKLGRADKDNGVLLLVAQQERKIRIEVGQGLEGLLTDAYSKRIIDETMVPLFRSGDASSGVLLGVVSIAKYTDPNVNLDSYFSKKSLRPQQPLKKEASLLSRLFSFLMFFFLFILFIRNPMLFLLLFAGGGRSGGFGGGGGYSGGGGGGFSGGGASGGW